MRCRIGVVLLLAALAVSPVLGGQEPQGEKPSTTQSGTPVFRSGVESVRFEAIVTDKDGNPITDLTPDDFVVHEDGALQTIEQFSRVFLPPPEPHQTRQKIRTDVATNDESQDRIYVIVMTNLNWQNAVRSVKIVRKFLDDYFSDNDLAAILTLDRGGALRFTNDRAALIREAERFVERFATPWAGSHAGAPFIGRGGFGGVRPAHYDHTGEVFGDIARALSHIEARRKSIIYIGGNPGFDPYDAIDRPKSTFAEAARAAMEPILAGNLSIYPIYPGEVRGPMASGSMRALAYVSGGTPTGTDYERTFRQIIRDNSAYYVLGYQSTNPKLDGGFRRIKVEVKRKGAKVRSRTGYLTELPPIKNPNALFSFDGRVVPPPAFIPPTDLTADLTKAMDSPVTLAAVPMTVFAASRKAAPQASSQRATVTVVVELPSSGLDLIRTDDEVSGQIDLAIGATSGLRTIRGTGFAYPVHLIGDAARQEFDSKGLRLTAEITLEPGEYRLGIAAGSRGGRFGKTFYDLTVPDYSQPLLALSGVSLTSESAGATLTLQPAGIQPKLPGPTTVSRVFDRSDTLALYTEVYENIWWTDTAHAITLTTSLVTDEGVALPVTTEQRASRAPQLKTGGYAFTAKVPLKDVKPGAYTLRIAARSDFDQPRTVTHDVPIQVR
jgi:VWFA-related protein